MLLRCCIAVAQVPNISVTCVLASQVKEEGVMKDAKPEWARGTLLTRQTANLSDVSASLHPHNVVQS